MDTGVVIIIAFLVFLAISAGTILVLWIAVPFSVFGTKALLKRLIEEQEKTNNLLRTMLETYLLREPYKGKDDEPEKRESTH